jgi:hypothetical protein
MNIGIDTTELIYLVLGPGALLIGALLLRADSRLKARCETLERRVADAERQLAMLEEAPHAAAAAATSARERELEQRIALLSRQQEQLMLRDAETGPYFQAVRQAERGADVVERVDDTGITRSEAELSGMLHGKSGGGAQLA